MKNNTQQRENEAKKGETNEYNKCEGKILEMNTHNKDGTRNKAEHTVNINERKIKRRQLHKDTNTDEQIGR